MYHLVRRPKANAKFFTFMPVVYDRILTKWTKMRIKTSALELSEDKNSAPVLSADKMWIS